MLDRINLMKYNTKQNICTCKEEKEHMFMNIEVERLRRYMSRGELANKLAVPVDVLTDWIYRRQAIPASKLCALSQLFEGCSVDYLLRARRSH